MTNYEEQVREITRERNAAIVAMRMEGLTFQQIGEAMGLTRQRIQQIVAEILEREGKQ